MKFFLFFFLLSFSQQKNVNERELVLSTATLEYIQRHKIISDFRLLYIFISYINFELFFPFCLCFYSICSQDCTNTLSILHFSWWKQTSMCLVIHLNCFQTWWIRKINFLLSSNSRHSSETIFFCIYFRKLDALEKFQRKIR